MQPRSDLLPNRLDEDSSYAQRREHLLSHEQEFLRIRDYFSCLYKGQPTPPVTLTQTICFEETEVQMAMSRLAAGKAMPQHSAPAVLWRKCSGSGRFTSMPAAQCLSGQRLQLTAFELEHV